jgi:hypothetical protein
MHTERQKDRERERELFWNHFSVEKKTNDDIITIYTFIFKSGTKYDYPINGEMKNFYSHKS